MPMLTTHYYRVRSVLLSHASSAVTVEPVRWLKDDPSGKTETDHGETYPASIDCDPTDEGAEPLDLGGKMTELRFDEVTDLQPLEYLTVTIERTATSYA